LFAGFTGRTLSFWASVSPAVMKKRPRAPGCGTGLRPVVLFAEGVTLYSVSHLNSVYSSRQILCCRRRPESSCGNAVANLSRRGSYRPATCRPHRPSALPYHRGLFALPTHLPFRLNGAHCPSDHRPAALVRYDGSLFPCTCQLGAVVGAHLSPIGCAPV